MYGIWLFCENQKKLKLLPAGKMLTSLVMVIMVMGGGGKIDSANNNKTNPMHCNEEVASVFEQRARMNEQALDRAKPVESGSE